MTAATTYWLAGFLLLLLGNLVALLHLRSAEREARALHEALLTLIPLVADEHWATLVQVELRLQQQELL